VLGEQLLQLSAFVGQAMTDTDGTARERGVAYGRHGAETRSQVSEAQGAGAHAEKYFATAIGAQRAVRLFVRHLVPKGLVDREEATAKLQLMHLPAAEDLHALLVNVGAAHQGQPKAEGVKAPGNQGTEEASIPIDMSSQPSEHRDAFQGLFL
jgi:hypothetical protein